MIRYLQIEVNQEYGIGCPSKSVMKKALNRELPCSPEFFDRFTDRETRLMESEFGAPGPRESSPRK